MRSARATAPSVSGSDRATNSHAWRWLARREGAWRSWSGNRRAYPRRCARHLRNALCRNAFPSASSRFSYWPSAMFRHVDRRDPAVGRDFEAHGRAASFVPNDVIEDGGFARQTGAGPVPIRKALLDGLVAPVHIEIACAVPGERRAIEPDLDMSARRNGRPAMAAARSEIGDEVGENFRLQRDRAPQRSHCQRRLFIDLDAEPRALPDDGARADGEPIGAWPQGLFAALCHGPSAHPGAVHGNIERAMLSRVDMTPKPPLLSIVRREYAADEGDNRQSEAVVGAERIDIPPGVAIGRNRFIEAKSARSASDASWPESAAIGMPGPGCTLPPAK